MKVYLVRHGDAVSPAIDPDRPLSPQGQEEVEKIAKFLAKNSFPLKAILHSHKLRAKQTAQIFQTYLAPHAKLEPHPHLAPDDPIGPISTRLEGEDEPIMIVGHLPQLSLLTSYLLTGQEEQPWVAFEPGTVACFSSMNGSWILDWIIGRDLF